MSVPCFEWSGQYGILTEARTANTYSTLTHLDYKDPGDEEPKMANLEIVEAILDFRKEEKESRLEQNAHRVVHTTRSTVNRLQEHPRCPQQGAGEEVDVAGAAVCEGPRPPEQAGGGERRVGRGGAE